MGFPESTRREFVKTGGAALAATAVSWNASSYAAIVGANDRVRVAVVGCGDRMKGALIPAFLQNSKETNFEFVAVSDLWNRRREEGVAYIEKLGGGKIDAVRNNDELYARKDVDAVLVATADFQFAHVADVEQAGARAHSLMLGDDSGVLQRHVPAAEVDHLGSEPAMDGIQSGFAQFHGCRCVHRGLLISAAKYRT